MQIASHQIAYANEVEPATTIEISSVDSVQQGLELVTTEVVTVEEVTTEEIVTETVATDVVTNESESTESEQVVEAEETSLVENIDSASDNQPKAETTSEQAEITSESLATTSNMRTLATEPLAALADNTGTTQQQAIGVIQAEVILLNNNQARDIIKAGSSAQYARAAFANYNNREVQLLNTNGDIVKTGFTNNGLIRFEELELGNYTLHLV